MICSFIISLSVGCKAEGGDIKERMINVDALSVTAFLVSMRKAFHPMSALTAVRKSAVAI
jgi:hypothetical protein